MGILSVFLAAASNASPTANLYFTNWQALSLGAISPTGEVTLTDVSVYGMNELDGLAFDSNGTPYVGYISSGTAEPPGIFRITPAGPERFAQTAQPRGTAFDANNNLYIADSSVHDIIRVEPSGAASTIFSFGSAIQPLRVGLNSQDQLFVAANAGVYRIDGPGSATLIVNGITFPSGLLPLGLAFDSSDNIYVGDHYNDRVIKFDQFGAFISVFADASDGISNPWGLAIDSDGSVFVANTTTSTILQFDGFGTLQTTFDASVGVDRPFSLAFAPAVPEPSGSLLLGVSLVVVGARTRRLEASPGTL